MLHNGHFRLHFKDEQLKLNFDAFIHNENVVIDFGLIKIRKPYKAVCIIHDCTTVYAHTLVDKLFS